MLENVPAVKEAYQEGRLVFGTLDSWLIYKLNGGPERDLVVTDSTNASRTGFMDLSTRQYDRELLGFYATPDYDLSRVRMPFIHPSADPVAYGSVRGGSLDGIPITGCVGDQSAALIGHRGFSVGSAKATYGTGCFCVCNTGSKIFDGQHGLLSTVAYDFGSEMAYALEGSIATAGSGVSFLVDNMGLAPDAAGISALADSVSDSGGVVFVTAFSGLFAPYWIDDARGTMFGITMKTQRSHIARAVLEAVCYQTKAAFDAALAYDDELTLKTLNVDGGMSQSNVCMQLQADILGVDIVRPMMCEITALGACFTAGLGAKIWNSTKELEQIDFTLQLARFHIVVNSFEAPATACKQLNRSLRLIASALCSTIPQFFDSDWGFVARHSINLFLQLLIRYYESIGRDGMVEFLLDVKRALVRPELGHTIVTEPELAVERYFPSLNIIEIDIDAS
ncbi:glycerol kinase, partial [Aureobasidium melanogenum]